VEFPSYQSCARIIGGYIIKVFSELELSKLKVRNLGFWFRTIADCEANANVHTVTVLPPIPTAGLSIEDVSALSTRVRDQMLTTLREISVTVPSEKPPLTEVLGDAASTEGTPTPTIPSEPTLRDEDSEPADMASATSSRVLQKDGSENGTETEEDEGMVLVGHPK
jgi:hypothetical protein